jgi:type 1 glutamine amidotransferase
MSFSPRQAALLGAFAVTLVATPALAQDFRVLVFSKTSAFRHGSISDGIAMIQALGAANDFAVDTTEAAGDFTAANLAQYAVVVWLNTTGDVLSSTQESAFRAYVESGGAWVGIHSATDTEYGWPWYGDLIGGDAWFDSHPSDQTATIEIEDQLHESTGHWPSSVSRFDEWYNFQNNPRSSVNVLVTVDEGSYSGGNMGGDHPIAWNHEIGSGRAWYTALGHHAETYDDADFRQHVLGGILWAAGETATLTCASSPLGGCIAAAQARLQVNEKTTGRESVSIALRKLAQVTTQSSFGEPVTGETRVALCIYDGTGALRGEMDVSRAGQFCGSKPCWRAMSDKGFQYGDRSAASDGTTKIQMKSGAIEKGQVQAKAANNAEQGETALSVGLAADLQGATQATIQLVTSDAACFSATLTKVTTADSLQFKASTP